MSHLFPKEFADLESVGRPWSIGSDRERHRRRLQSSVADMQVFYDAVFPRAHEILAYCDRFDMRDPPKEVRALLNMLYSLIVVSFSVGVRKQAMASDSDVAPVGMGPAAARRRRHRAPSRQDQDRLVRGEATTFDAGTRPGSYGGLARS
jgi:hypothetical protein